MTSDPNSHSADHLRTHDFDWYAALQFAPADKRPACMALFAFLAEVARVRSLVSDPMPGEIRLQYWRDTLSGTTHGEVEANPLAANLLQAIDTHSIPTAPLLAVLDARTFDLYDNAQPTMGDLEGYAGEAWSGPISLAASVLSGENPASFADAAGHGGVALCIADILVDLPRWSARGQCFLPSDLMEKHSLKRADLAAGKPTPELTKTLQTLAEVGANHLEKAAGHVGSMPASAHAVLLPFALARQTFSQADTWAGNPFRQPLQTPKWRRLWLLWRASKRMPAF